MRIATIWARTAPCRDCASSRMPFGGKVIVMAGVLRETWGPIAQGLCLPKIGNHAHAGGSTLWRRAVGWLCGGSWDDDATSARARDWRATWRGRALNMYAPTRRRCLPRCGLVPLPIACAVEWVFAVPLVRWACGTRRARCTGWPSRSRAPLGTPAGRHQRHGPFFVPLLSCEVGVGSVREPPPSSPRLSSSSRPSRSTRLGRPPPQSRRRIRVRATCR